MVDKPSSKGLNKFSLDRAQCPNARQHFDGADAEEMAEMGRKIEALEMLVEPLSDINLRLLSAQVAQLQGMRPENRALLVRIYRDEEAHREGPKIWRAIFPND